MFSMIVYSSIQSPIKSVDTRSLLVLPYGSCTAEFILSNSKTHKHLIFSEYFDAMF